MTATLELPRISIKADVKRAEARPFVGKIVADVIGPNKFYDEVADAAKPKSQQKPYQWSLGVEPLKSSDGTKGFQIGGRTGAFWEYISISLADLEGETKQASKFGRHFDAFKKVFGTDDDRAIGRGEYLEEVAWFIKDKIQYGTDKTSGAQIEGSVLYPVRALTPEEMVEYGLAAGVASRAQVPAEGYADTDLDALAVALDGKDRNALQKAAFQSKLPNAIRTGVGKGDGPAIVALLSSGRATFDGDVLRAAA